MCSWLFFAVEIQEKMSTNQEEESILGESEQAMREPCRQYVDVLMYCYSPANQVSTYYRIGLVDDCNKPLHQLKLCLKLKSDLPDEERLRVYKELKRQDEHAPSSKIWQMRENPGKDWNTSTTT